MSALQPKVIHWDRKWGPITEDAMTRMLWAEGYTVSKYHYAPGVLFPMHTHARDKKDTVLRGRLRIAWEGGDAVLEPGDMIEIPAGCRHSAEVVGTEAVISLDATRQDPRIPNS